MGEEFEIDSKNMKVFLTVGEYNRETRTFDYFFLDDKNHKHRMPRTTKASFSYDIEMNQASLMVGDNVPMRFFPDGDSDPQLVEGTWYCFSEQIPGKHIFLSGTTAPPTWEFVRNLMHNCAILMLPKLLEHKHNNDAHKEDDDSSVSVDSDDTNDEEEEDDDF